MPPTERCPICLRECAWDWLRDGGSMSAIVDCKQCGKYECTQSFVEDLTGGDRPALEALLAALSGYTRQASEAGERVQLRSDDWGDLARSHSNTPVSQKLERLLHIGRLRSQYPGAQFRIEQHDFPLIDAASDRELGFLVDHMISAGYFEGHGTSSGASWNPFCNLTTKAWERLQGGSVGVPKRCFVAMWFDTELDSAWRDGFYPALKGDCQLDPVRLDLVHHNEKICDRILAEIRQAHFVVADFTGHRGGVYFEAGFALGLGRPAIWTCPDDHLGAAHFDTRQYNHIAWSQPADLRVKLRDRVKATILK